MKRIFFDRGHVMISAQQEIFATLTSVLDHHPHQLSLIEVKPLIILLPFPSLLGCQGEPAKDC